MNSTNQTFSTADVSENITRQIQFQIQEVHYFDTSKPIQLDTYTYNCSTTHECQPYKFVMGPGCYFIELYGASGGSYVDETNAMRYPDTIQTITEESILQWGGNAVAKPIGSSGGAGGHVRGTICLRREVQAFLHIGGKGGNPQGGYNGGGSGNALGGSGGGGSTDLRFEVDDVWHRVLVAAGGGGGDDALGSIGKENDGSGGCGGGLEGQGMWFNGVYNNKHIATQTGGFSFFQGEAYESGNTENTFISSTTYEISGAGGGWFGGFASRSNNAGAGGGSSFVLHANAEIPEGNITLYTEKYTSRDQKPYAFTHRREFFFRSFAIVSGIRSGNGFARITKIDRGWFDQMRETIPHSLKLMAVFGLCLF